MSVNRQIFRIEPAAFSRFSLLNRCTVVLGLVAMLGWPSFVLAEDSALIEEVVVTAQRREQNLSEVPQAIQALLGEELERSAATDFTDIVHEVPGSSVVSMIAPGFETMQLRGVSSGTVGDATVGYYIDEVPFSVPNLQLTPPARLVDLERVEVLHGPSGTLYGQGSMGGTIKVITKDPNPNDFGLKVNGEVSDTSGGGSNYAIGGAVNVPIATDTFGIRVSGSQEELSGFADDEAHGNDINDYKGSNVRVKAKWMPTDDLDVTLSYWNISNDYDFSNQLTSLDPPTINSGGHVGYTDTNADYYSMFIAWETGIGRLESGTTYLEHELDFDLGFDVGIGFPFVNDSDFQTDSFTQELRLVSTSVGKFDWIVGGYFRDASIDSSLDLGYPDIPFPVLVSEGVIDTKSWSIYGEGAYRFLEDRLVATVGLRYFEDDRNRDGIDLLTMEETSGGDTFDSVNPRFNLAWHATEDGLLYLNIAKGFRSGTVQTITQAQLGQMVGIPSNEIIDPDELWNYELGTKWQFADGMFILDAAIYYTDWTDIQVPFYINPLLVSVVNGGDAEIYGIDFGFSWLATDRLSISGNANFNSAEFSDVDPALTAVAPYADEGEPLPGVPESTRSIQATYTLPLGSSGLNGYAFGRYSFRDKQRDLRSGVYSGTLEDVEVRFGVQGDRWELYLFGANLLNDLGSVSRSPTIYNAAYPRRIGLQLQLNFE